MSGEKRDVANDESDARKQDEMYLIILKHIYVEAEIESSGSFSFRRKILDFIDAELKNQVIGLQLATEIKLYPEIFVITRYWNIELVNDNRAWIPRLMELHGPTLDLIFTQPLPTLCD